MVKLVTDVKGGVQLFLGITFLREKQTRYFLQKFFFTKQSRIKNSKMLHTHFYSGKQYMYTFVSNKEFE